MWQQDCSRCPGCESPAHIGVPDERDVPDRLNSHHPGKFATLHRAPEKYALCHFFLQFRGRHVRFMPTVLRQCMPRAGLGGIIDDFPDHPIRWRGIGASSCYSWLSLF